MSESLYLIGQTVHYVPEGCSGQIVKIRRSIGTLTRYDLMLDTGELEEYVDEIYLYPQRLYKTKPVVSSQCMAFKIDQKVFIPDWNRIGVIKHVLMCAPTLGKGRDFLYEVELEATPNRDVFTYKFFTFEIRSVVDESA